MFEFCLLFGPEAPTFPVFVLAPRNGDGEGDSVTSGTTGLVGHEDPIGEAFPLSCLAASKHLLELQREIKFENHKFGDAGYLPGHLEEFTKLQ